MSEDTEMCLGIGFESLSAYWASLYRIQLLSCLHQLCSQDLRFEECDWKNSGQKREWKETDKSCRISHPWSDYICHRGTLTWYIA